MTATSTRTYQFMFFIYMAPFFPVGNQHRFYPNEYHLRPAYSMMLPYNNTKFESLSSSGQSWGGKKREHEGDHDIADPENKKREKREPPVDPEGGVHCPFWVRHARQYRGGCITSKSDLNWLKCVSCPSVYLFSFGS